MRKALTLSLILSAVALAQLPVSAPTPKPQPAIESYGWAEMTLFRTAQTADDFAKVFGAPAPAYDSSRRLKLWYDTTVDQTDPEELVCYTVVKVKNSMPALGKACMPAWEAATPNVPPIETPSQPARQRPAWELPIRAMLPNEALVPSLFGGWAVIRTDMRLQREQIEGKFTPEDRRLLEAVARKLGVIQ